MGTEFSQVDEQHKSRVTSEKGQLTDTISTEHRGTITSRNKHLAASEFFRFLHLFIPSLVVSLCICCGLVQGFADFPKI
jgi:hypothetical protein